MFNTLYLIVFLGLSALIYWIIKSKRGRLIYLDMTSLLWIWYWQPKAVYVVLGLTVFTWGWGWLLQRVKYKKTVLGLGIFSLLMALVWWKYLQLLLESIKALGLGTPNWVAGLILPLGLSYLVFKYISYLVDIHWRLTKGGRPCELLAFGSLFTVFAAGPMERFDRFWGQFDTQPRLPQRAKIEEGLMRMAEGLFLKVVLADWLAWLITPLWAEPLAYSLPWRVLALFGYGMRIYFDFAGYSGIAIGASLLFGLKVSENFRSPYLSRNIGEFWRRWHISLSDWIRDYLFFPLSTVSKNKLWLWWLVPALAMTLCGLWHGAAWHFALWGLWHGVGIALFQMWQRMRKRRGKKSQAGLGKELLSGLVCFLFVNLGWLMFHDEGLRMASALWQPELSIWLPLFGFAILILLRSWDELNKLLLTPRWRAVYAIILSVIFYCGMQTGFIYASF